MRVRALWFGTATLVVVSVLFATVQVSVCAKVPVFLCLCDTTVCDRIRSLHFGMMNAILSSSLTR